MRFSDGAAAGKPESRKETIMAKTARSIEQPSSVTPEIDPSAEAPRTGPTQDDIALRAYNIYLDREGAAGDSLEDWLQAERELTESK